MLPFPSPSCYEESKGQYRLFYLQIFSYYLVIIWLLFSYSLLISDSFPTRFRAETILSAMYLLYILCIYTFFTL